MFNVETYSNELAAYPLKQLALFLTMHNYNVAGYNVSRFVQSFTSINIVW